MGPEQETAEAKRIASRDMTKKRLRMDADLVEETASALEKQIVEKLRLP